MAQDNSRQKAVLSIAKRIVNNGIKYDHKRFKKGLDAYAAENLAKKENN